MTTNAKRRAVSWFIILMLVAGCRSKDEHNDIRPRTRIEFKGHKFLALVDTGSSLSSIPRSWLSQADLASISKSETRGSVGSYSADVVPIAGLLVAATQTGPQNAFVTRGSPAVGTAALFSKTSVYLTRHGVKLGIDAAKLCRGHQPITTVFDLSGRLFEDPISAIYLRMKVNNQMTDVMLDTGRSNTIVTYGGLPEVLSLGFPRVLSITGSEGRRRTVLAQSIQARLNAGDWSLTVPGTIYDAPSPTRAKFTLGAGILRYISIVMAPKKGIGCIIPLSDQSQGSIDTAK